MDSLNLVNSGKPYFIRLDIAKESGKLARFSDWLKTRVNDNGKKVPIKWYDQGQEMNIHGFYPYMQGGVGHFTTDENNNPVPSSDVVYREWQGTPDDVTDSGIVYYTLEDQFFSSQGEFVGTFGLRDTAGNNYTGVNVIFEVLGNDFRIAQTKKYYITELDNLKIQYEDATKQFMNDAKAQADQALAQTRADVENGVQPIRDSLNLLDGEIKLNRANEENLEQQLNYNQQLINNQNIVTRPEHQQDIDNLSSAINQRLSQMKTNPIAVANAGALTTQYPKGADGIFITADTGHKWVYLDGAWKDCGEYQAIGIENEELDPIKSQVSKQQVQIDQNSNNIALNSLGVKDNTTRIENIEGAGTLTSILLTDQNGNYITDDRGHRIGGCKWLPLTDTTLTQTGLPADGQAVGNAIKSATTFKPEDYDIQVLYLWGDKITSLKDKSVTLTNEVTYEFPHYHIQGTLSKFKVQGASSVYLPKKNYTLNFDQSFEAFGGMGKQHKYVIKANYKDATQSLNNVGTKLWGKIRGTHLQSDGAIQNSNGDYLVDDNGNHIIGVTDPQLSIGGNYGAVNGFPIAVYINDQYWGLYSFNVPKDDWMAKMPKSGKYAIVDAVWKDQGAFNAETTFKDNMELQFCSTKDNTWAKDSINELIRAAKAHYDTVGALDTALAPLVDYDSVYDYYIYSVLTGNVDGVYRNYLLQTFDGKKWYFSAYDMDESFGKTPQDSKYLSAYSTGGDDFWHEETTFENIANNNRLFYQFWKFHKDEVLKRTKDLISGVMSAPSVDSTFINYSQSIPRMALIAENKVWKNTPDTSVNTIDRIGRWYHDRIDWTKNTYLENQ